MRSSWVGAVGGALALTMGGAVLGCGAAPEPEHDASTEDAAAAPALCDESVFDVEGPLADPVHWVNGGACTRAQTPIDVATIELAVSPGTDDGTARYRSIAATCWRVTDAAPGSGWAVGDVVISERPWARVALVGFERPVTFEGRAVAEDGRVLFVVPPASVALEAPVEVISDASALVAVMGRQRWATAERLTAFGAAIPAGGTILDATQRDARFAPVDEVVVLERRDGDHVLRVFAPDGDGVVEETLALGAAERARLAPGGWAVALDAEVVLLRRDAAGLSVSERRPLEAAPAALFASEGRAVAHVGERLVGLEADGAAWTLEVGDAAVVGDLPGGLWVVTDTTLSHVTRARGEARLEPGSRFAPDVRARIGPLLGRVAGPVLVGRDGWMLGGVPPAAGPRVGTVADIFGGGRISLLSDDGLYYAIARDDGSTTLHRVPHYEGPPITCE